MKRDETARRAREIYERLMRLPRPTDISNNTWAAEAGVNTSFFTNLRNGSEPSIGNLRKVLEVVDVSLPEFFLSEADGRLIPAVSKETLETALLEALPDAPRRLDKRARFLAEVVSQILQLPADLHSTEPNLASKSPADCGEGPGVRSATN